MTFLRMRNRYSDVLDSMEGRGTDMETICNEDTYSSANRSLTTGTGAERESEWKRCFRASISARLTRGTGMVAITSEFIVDARGISNNREQ